MKTLEEVETIAQTIIWLAEERMKTEPFQNINSAIHAVTLDVSEFLMDFMKDTK